MILPRAAAPVERRESNPVGGLLSRALMQPFKDCQNGKNPQAARDERSLLQVPFRKPECRCKAAEVAQAYNIFQIQPKAFRSALGR